MMSGWLVPILLYVVTLGSLGVTSRLALRTYSWQDMLIWTTLAYIVVAAALMVGRQGRIRVSSDLPWVVLSSVIVVVSLILLYTALTHGPASSVIPVSASYPAVTLLLAAATLGERISFARAGGVALVVGGVVVLTRT